MVAGASRKPTDGPRGDRLAGADDLGGFPDRQEARGRGEIPAKGTRLARPEPAMGDHRSVAAMGDREGRFASGRHLMVRRVSPLRAKGETWGRWACVAVLTALLVVGHDLLMAGDAHAVAGPTHLSAVSLPAHARADDSFRHASATGDGSATEVADPFGACGTSEPATWRPADLGLEDTGEEALPGTLLRLGTRFAIAAAALPPTLSPRARRALLQVFRL